MLQKHVDMCREEDDSTNIMGLDNMANYDSEEEDEDEDEDEDDLLSLNAEGMWLLNRIICSLSCYKGFYSLNTFLDSDSSKKNNNEKPVIKPVPETQCHCCAEDLKTAHNGGEYKCSHCDLSFKKKASLERHIIVIHWKCDSCICNECGSSFRDKKALNKHRYTTHGDRKIFKYVLCMHYFPYKIFSIIAYRN